MLRQLFLVGLAVSLATGCQAPTPGLTSDVLPRMTAMTQEQGIVTLRVKWPASAAMQVQALPVAARTAVFTVSTAQGDMVATRTVSREGDTVATVRIALTPGEGYVLAADMRDSAGDVIAKGTSAPFTILRQRVSTVDVTVDPIISLVAGTGAFGYTGDGDPATEAKFFTPLGLTVDRQGHLYIADSANHAIRKVEPRGPISTVVGTGKMFSGALAVGDNGTATETALNRPNAVAMAANGDLYIADSNNHAIRMVPAVSGERYGQTLKAGKLHTLLVDSNLVGPFPPTVTVDPMGNVFYGEELRIKMIGLDGASSVVAGGGASDKDGPALAASLNIPDGFLCDPAGNLLFTERNTHRVRMLCRVPGTYFGIPMASGSIYTLAGKGVPTTAPASVTLGDGKDGLEATLNTPRGLALDARGNLYIADYSNQRIRRLTPERRISTIAGSGTKSSFGAPDVGDGGAALGATFSNPVGLAVHQDFLYIVDSGNHRVRRVPL